ncbi:MAG: sensor histidine kinase [Nostocales cyanobacterium]|nr:MAG: sensor histidine kinase [Nostocales cyanobacterium]
MNLKSKVMSFTWLRYLFQRLSIRQKIVCGYALSLGIAILGTTGGLIIGDRYYQSARQGMHLEDEEGTLLSSLQGVLLNIQVHQQKQVPNLRQSPDLQSQHPIEFEEHFQEFETLFSRLKEVSLINSRHDLQILINKHENHITQYFQKLRNLNQQIYQVRLQPGGLAKTQQLIGDFYQSQTALNFFIFCHDLTDFAQAVNTGEEQADLAQKQAAMLQAQIIIASMLLSVSIATILAVYTSRIIARPINTVTNIAQRVTKEANFELQAYVNTKDEIGTLADALNQLIQQVKLLLEIQDNEAQIKLIQSEKMSSLGRMLAGVAHEINNPINFISGNLVHAQTYVDDLLTLLKTYQETIPIPPDEVQAVSKEIDLDFLETDLPKILNSMTLGTERTREIVRSLKNFSRLDEVETHLVDLHPCIDSTLLILNNRLKHSINIIRSYGEIPLVPGYMGLLYQVFMNLLSNAIDAVEEKSHSNSQFFPEITIITESPSPDWVVVRIADNGSGISPEHQNKIFETFFTTKPRGIGTGLGLAITHQIVVEKHRGKISCHSELNQGTEFAISLPINPY